MMLLPDPTTSQSYPMPMQIGQQYQSIWGPLSRMPWTAVNQEVRRQHTPSLNWEHAGSDEKHLSLQSAPRSLGTSSLKHAPHQLVTLFLRYLEGLLISAFRCETWMNLSTPASLDTWAIAWGIFTKTSSKSKFLKQRIQMRLVRNGTRDFKLFCGKLVFLAILKFLIAALLNSNDFT